ncbi:MAG: MFS transporter, partial [Chlamydiae bacterium]|nr:MFS transporter [Chlamydiota bacterium]
MAMFFPKKKSHFFSMISFLRKRFSFPCLVGSQFLGALNDNIYKLLTIFLLISSLGVAKSSVILSSVGALYVIPFLLFSSAAGILADRLSKQKLILGLKGFEVVIMALSILAFSYKSVWGSYSLLFLLATHSAFFGPSKYSIIPELVEKKEVAKANSHITAFTYLAIIIGTFLASFLSDITQGNYAFSVAFCLLFAICGFLSSLGIKETEAQKSKQKINLFFLKEIFQTIL